MYESANTARANHDPTEAAARRGARVAVALFATLSTLFVLSSTWQLATAALGIGADGLGSTGATLSPLGACATSLSLLDDALELGLRAATAEETVEGATKSFDAKTQPIWRHAAETKEACTREPAGLDAFAKVERLHWAVEASMQGQAVALAQARADVAAVLGR